jgi:HEAT repeat protein
MEYHPEPYEEGWMLRFVGFRRALSAVALAGAMAAAAPAPAQPRAGAPAARQARRPAPAGDIDSKRAALRGADVDRAEAAALQLGDAGGPAAREALLDGLAAGLSPKVAAAALAALGKYSDAEAYETLAFYARYRNGKVRAVAVTALGASKDSRAEAAVVRALHDSDPAVRAAASQVVAARKIKGAVPTLVELLKRGDEGAAAALAALASPDLARDLGELIAVAPDGPLARCLGAILMRSDFGPEQARVQVVRALGKIPGNDALEQLTTYVAATPEKPPRQSRREAEALVEQRLSGGN